MNAIAVANHLIECAEASGHTLSQMKLQKLLIFAHGWHLALAGSPLFDEPILAGPFGPYVHSVFEGCYGFGSGDLRGHRILPAWRNHPPMGHHPGAWARIRAALSRALCQCGRHEWKKLAYGFPPFKSTWLEVEGCLRCGKVRRTWDDLFAPARADAFPAEPRHADLMTYLHPAARAYVLPCR